MSDKPLIDLRSDTVTQPTPAMREAMMAAEVGDDVYGEDPNVNALQEEVAQLLGKEAALFVPTGTMANQIALKTHTQPGDEVVAHPMAHIVRAESAAAAALSGVQFRMVGAEDGTLPPQEVQAVIQDGSNVHFAPTRLICMENTHNFKGGAVVPLSAIQSVAKVGQAHGIPLHLDGARVLNAAVALDIKPDKITSHFDSSTLCFSKGLGAPVGSVIAGTRDFIMRCQRYRKMFGGGMRQSGFLAAAARHALKHHVERLAEDHRNAKRLAEGLRENKHITLDFGLPQTNIIFFSLNHPDMDVPRLMARLAERGVLMGGSGPYSARAVTHLNVDAEGIEKAINAVNQVLAG